MIPAIVFSKNRPMQLDALLSSLDQNAPGVFDASVLWEFSDASHREGYDKLIHGAGRYGTTITWKRETDFRADVLRLLPKTGRVVFFTDDSILYRPLPRLPSVSHGWAAFSLRLGENTTRCYPHDRDQQVPVQLRGCGTWAAWNWRLADGDFGYPASLDGHIFHAELIRSMLADRPFTNPNTLEDVLASLAHAHMPLTLASFGQSCLVGIPANQVTDTHRTNRRAASADGGSLAMVQGTMLNTSPEALNDFFLAGYRIDWRSMDFSGVDGAHAEIPYVLTKELR